MTTIKGIFGSPLCLDVSHDRSLLAAGYEDDTFLIYSMHFGGVNSACITPLCRGQGHKSFVSQIKFDTYLMEFLSREKAKLEEEVKEEQKTQMNLMGIQPQEGGEKEVINPSQMLGRKTSN